MKLKNSQNSSYLVDGRLVPKDDCMKFLEQSHIRDKVVLGIEGFFLNETGGHRPNIDEIADFSKLAGNVRESHDAAHLFVGAMLRDGESDAYSFVLSDL